MNAATRVGSNGPSARPSRFRSDPTITPSADFRANASVAAVTPVAVKAVAPVVAKKAAHPRIAAAAKPGKDIAAAAEPAPRGLFRRKRNQVQHVALGSEGSGVAAIMQRALGRF